MAKKLSVAFIWHMHQPLYKDHLTGQYFMPWVRLHAIKDYLDMVTILEDFPKIRQTFNLVPSLIDQLDDYGHNNAHDFHSLLTIKPEKDFTHEDKIFILERFFDANYQNMILKNKEYNQLYQRSRGKSASRIVQEYSNQEYADIIMWFNLVWFDPVWLKKYSELKEYCQQGNSYTIEQRKRVLEIQREIIRNILPVYKEYQEKGQIEVIVSPYYHPILPLIIDTDAAKISRPDLPLPSERFQHPEDAKVHIERAIKKYTEIFGHAPKGMWPSEESVSPEAVKLMAEAGIQWAVSDEGVLSTTIGKDFHRNFYGNLEKPKDLCQPHKIEIDGNSLDMVFRNVVYSDLIGFQFAKMESHRAAWELYDRIKDIQEKLVNSTDDHLLTIALDGENCWEYYELDGIPFLKKLYTMLTEDNTLDITTVSDYLEKHPPAKTLNHIHSGSWINKDFHIWIGDSAKNTGWDYLKRTRDDMVRLLNSKDYDEETVQKAWEELYIAEGSDWFWWYGDPNFSSQDDLFDEQFRLHLQNVYRVLGEPIPSKLFVPVEVYLGRSLKYPSAWFTPSLNGELDSQDEWRQAGVIEIPSGAMYQSNKLIRRVWFGFDQNNLNIRIDTTQPVCNKEYEIYIYAYNPGRPRYNSNIRLRNTATQVAETLKYKYAYELFIDPKANNIVTTFSEAIDGGLWQIHEKTNTRVAASSVVELAIPFDELNVSHEEEIHFVIAMAKSQVIQQIVPENQAISVKRC
jgi:alpha-amylase/alpha-mannosidase (GH57 family)